MSSGTTNPHGSQVIVGVIAGSGLYKLFTAENDVKYYKIETPFGSPSADVCVAVVNGVSCAFIPRHGSGHTLNPSEVNYRANIYALKLLGVRYLIGINAVGSLDSAFMPGDLALVDQIIDRTTKRQTTYFEDGIVAHVDYAFPTSRIFRFAARDLIHKSFPGLSEGKLGWRLHEKATTVTIEGPQFSTKAESQWNKSIGAHLVGMTTSTEAKLAREAEMAYVVIAMVTDMDAWSDAPHVIGNNVCNVMAENAEKTRKCVMQLIEMVGNNPFVDPAHSSLEHAICTKIDAVPKAVRQRLAIFLTKYSQFAP